jgi:nitrite reductase (cytochrome c-552)
MKSIRELVKEKTWFAWLLFIVTIVVVFFLGLLASSIVERRAEAVFTYTPKVEHSQFEPRNEVWGKNFPREYQSYLQTSDTSFRSKFNGSVEIDMLEEDPRMVVLWAGYGFSKDYTQGRGHYYAVKDVRHTLRTGAPMEGKNSPMPNTCWTCKSPDVPRVMNDLIEEKGDFQAGVAAFYEGAWETRGHQIVNPIGCADCHDAEDMSLRISRPALIEAYKNIGKDITKASHQEMRSLVCAQCHVEYYFNTNIVEGVPYLKFPWDNGMSADEMEVYYDNMEFSDWTHQISKAPMLKAQHPGYETFITGVHYQRGVSCADCHMPYMTEGGIKYTDHHIQSPLNNIANSCQVCHREETERLVQDVYSRQEKIYENRVRLEKFLVRAHVEASVAWDLGATKEEIQDILMDIRHAQWRWDYAVASHGASIHSPVETSRVIASGIAIAQEARVKLARLLSEKGYKGEVPYPDISTKAEAQAFIGIDMQKLNSEKEEFLNTIVPVWMKMAAEREDNYKVEMVSN